MNLNSKIAGIICEYNPLHNGHLYHIQETKKHGADAIIAVMSDHFVQRGDVALLSKFDRAELAVRAGADLVLELPVIYSCAPAEIYASGAVRLLKNLNLITTLSFGSSVNNPEELIQLVKNSNLILDSHREELRKFLKSGKSYPASVAELCRIHNLEQAILLRDANNLLAVEYLQAMQKLHADWEIFTIPREQVDHDSKIPGTYFASASYLREKILQNHSNQINSYIPKFTQELLERRLQENQFASLEFLESAILYRLRIITESELLSLPDMTPPLAKRFLKYQNTNSLEEFLRSVKTKCFTMARIRRILIYAMLHLTRQEQAYFRENQPYARILAFNQKGSELLKILKKTSKIPLGTSLTKLSAQSPDAKRFAQIENRAAQIYGLAHKKITSAEQEFTYPIKELAI
ncbi:MAG: nucleotidyltransferase family protein [Oscillospiraceae bacterium]|nr:nucleotidyltransferase family protein [Oscillospiraceae bacterium]